MAAIWGAAFSCGAYLVFRVSNKLLFNYLIIFNSLALGHVSTLFISFNKSTSDTTGNKLAMKLSNDIAFNKSKKYLCVGGNVIDHSKYQFCNNLNTVTML
jgi:hypothetical protein